MDDIKAIEQFLETIKESAKSGCLITPQMVYSNLIFLGQRIVNNRYIDNNFSDWIDSFKEVNNINVFVNNNSSYFCHFVNDNNDVIASYNMIKMYIPVDDAHINEAGKRIFEFMAKNKIIHQSKIGSKVRFDDIVIRVSDEESAKKIEEFVMHDPYIREGLMKPNPFAFNNGYISYVWDGDLSFNIIVSSYISGYINELKANNCLDDTSYKGLVAYIGKVYETVFKEGKYKNDYIENMEVEDEYQLDNYRKITELLLHSIMPDKKNEDFFRVYDDIVLEKNIENDDTKTYISQKQKDNWNSIYDFLVKKYGHEGTNQLIFKFLETNNYALFTKENGVRNYLIDNNITKDMVKELFLLTTKAKRDILYFTNDNGERDKLLNTISPGEIRGLIIGKYLEKGYDITDIPNEEEIYKEYIYQLETKNNSKNRA